MKKHRINYFRISIQWIILLLIIYMLVRPVFDKRYLADFEAYCPFGGMQSLASYFSSHSLACSMTTVQIALGIALLLGVVLFSKLFCSFICPIGTFTELLGTWGRKIKLNFTLKGVPDRVLRALKYILLFFTFYFTVTSSELFCRKFDPYYAVVTGFSGDVFLWYALPALILVIAGSFFIRQFWCKYICPVGAITNLAVYALPVSAVVLLWTILGAIGISISWVWLLGSLSLLGFLLEATTLKFLIFPTLRITRNDELCSNCRICDKICPMAIPISNMGKVDHIDCHLCVDCVIKCPEKGALTINKRNLTWLPALATIILIASAILFASYYELPTISEKWGKHSEQQLKILTMDGLKSIKCFGSSRSFANQMKTIDGIEGVETFVKHHRVKIWYDPSKLNAEQVKEAIFSPYTELLNYTPSSKVVFSFVTFGVDRCFDVKDQYYLSEILRKDKGVTGFTTRFGEPIQATIYIDPTLTTVDKIKTAVGQKSVLIGEGKNEENVETGFVVRDGNSKRGVISLNQFLQVFVEKTDVSFNNFETYKTDDLLIYSLPFAPAGDLTMAKWMPFLISHLSNNEGVVRVQTEFTADGPELKIWFAASKTTPANIKALLTEPEFLVYYPDKSVKKIKNPYNFN